MISPRAEELFTTVKELDPAAREEFLMNACGNDTDLRIEVESLLTAANAAEFYFDGLAQRFGLIALADSEEELPEQKILGSWRLLELIGRGGMGAVYLVERADGQFEQKAALKILPAGISTKDDRHRFLAERQILAGLDHESIARLVDGGVSEDGTPYFVMDFVDGVPIDEFCDTNRLSVADRLAMFLQICEAVQYAHRKLVVHRDIKTGNVLVEAEGRVRLLDFGIAKILQSGDNASALTQVAYRPMTPAYASPEMIQGKPVDVTTDVYSLGVLLYRLMTGRVPVDVAGLSPAQIEEAVVSGSVITASESIRRMSRTDAELLTDTAQNRGCDARRLQSLLAGDIDTIIGKAIAKDAGDRYESVASMAQDIRDHLEGKPVKARPPSLAYQTRKFIARHKLGVGFAAASALMLLTITILAVSYALTTERQSEQIAHERDRAQEITSFLVSVFQSADPDQPAADMTAQQILDQGRTRIVEELSDQPSTQVELLKAMSEVYNGMRMNSESKEVLYQELGLREELAGTESAEYADVLLRLAQITDAEGSYDESERYARQALAISNKLVDRELQAWSHTRLGRVLHLKGDYETADTHYRQSLAIYQELHGTENEHTVKAMEHLANLLNHQGRLDESLVMFEEILDIRERILGPEHSEVGPALLGLGAVLTKLDRHADAIAVYERAFDLNEKLFGPDNRRNMYIVNGLGKVAQAMGDYELAARHYTDAGRLVHMYFGEHGNLGITKKNLGTAHSLNGRYDLALPVLQESVAILEKKIPNHWHFGDARWRLGLALMETGKLEDAEPWLTSGYDIVSEKLGMEHESTQAAIDAVARFYEASDRQSEAMRFREMQVAATD